MAEDAKAHSGPAGSPRRKALVHWLSGVVFAVVLGAVLSFAGPHMPWLGGGLSWVEARGVDFAMRMQAYLSRWSEPAGDHQYVYLDLDEAACLAGGGGARCGARSPAEPGLALRLAAAAGEAGARVVIVDVYLWDQLAGESATPGLAPSRDAAEAALRDLAANHPQARIVAPSPFRPTGPDRTGISSPEIAMTGPAGAPLRYAPAFTWKGSHEQDDVVRRYPMGAYVRAPGSDHGDWRPTLPYLAALYATADGLREVKAVDCLLEPCKAARIRLPAPAHGAPACPAQGCSAAQVREILRTEDEGLRLLFSLPGLVPEQATGRPAWMSGRTNLHVRYAVSDIVKPASLDPGRGAVEFRLPSEFKDKIVVISTSAVTALDRHRTPLHEMSGAEVVLNATHAFLQGALLKEHPPSFRHELIGAFLSSLPFLAFWLFYFHVVRGWSGLTRTLLGPPVTAVAFFMAMGGGALIATLLSVLSLSRLQQGFVVDFYMPIFALSLEGFADGAKWLMEQIEHLVERGLRLAERIAGTFPIEDYSG